MEGVNAVGKRVSLLNDEVPAASGRSIAALPYHHGPPAPPKSALPRTPALDAWKPSYSSRSNSSTTTTSHSSSSSAHNTLSNSSSDSDSPYPPRDSRHSSSSATSSHYSPAARSIPQLLRHDSSSSSQSLSTPSPMTPTTFYEPLDQGKSAINGDPSAFAFAQAMSQQSASALSQQPSLANGNVAAAAAAAAAAGAFYPSSLPTGQAMYPSFTPMSQPMLSDPYAMPAPAVQYQFATELIDTMTPASGLAGASLGSAANLNGVAANGHPPPVGSQDTASNGNSSSSSSTTQKAKKKYPCPYAARYNCTDTFTTSGHAARHGKKHTGEKNILCPTCHKAFTRKDNMKQHERTHKNRNNNSVDETKSVNGNSRRTHSISSVAASAISHKSSNSTEMELESPTLDAVDSKRNSYQRPGLGRPAQYTGGPTINGSDVKADHPLQMSRPELNRQFSGESQDGEGESPGLDALAMAASELR